MKLLDDKFLIQESNSIIGVNDHKVVSKIKPNDEIIITVAEHHANIIPWQMLCEKTGAKLIAVPDIPRTRSGKITELAVRDIVHGKEIKNKEALANPEALIHFANIPDLSTD